MTIYLDSNFNCHLNQNNSYLSIETDYFNGMCSEYIENYRFIPSGYTWTRFDGVTFSGEMITPIINYNNIKTIQDRYEKDIAQKFYEFSIPQEFTFKTTQNYSQDSYLAIQENLYKVLTPIPLGAKIIPQQNVIQITLQEYLNSLQEGNNETPNL